MLLQRKRTQSLQYSLDLDSLQLLDLVILSVQLLTTTILVLTETYPDTQAATHYTRRKKKTCLNCKERNKKFSLKYGT